jgi:CRISPR type I-E-associated protein CasB/Cse2
MTTETKAMKRKSIAMDYIAHLLKLRRDNGAMAMLRRGLGKVCGTLEMYRYVYPLVPEDRAFLSEENFFQVAALFALHPETCTNKSFGRSFRELWQARDRNESIESRFKILLAADKDSVATHLHGAMTMMKDKGIRVDYSGLLVDLNNWDDEDGPVQKEWAKDFWGNRSKK